MYPCTKFKSFCKTLDYETKDTQKLSLTKIKKKINMKDVISI